MNSNNVKFKRDIVVIIEIHVGGAGEESDVDRDEIKSMLRSDVHDILSL